MKKLVNFRLSVLIALSLCVGIFSVYLSFCKNYFLLILTICLFVCALSLYVFLPLKFNKDGLKSRIIFALVFIVCFIIGFSNVYIKTQNYVNANLNDRIYTVSGRVTKVNENDYGNSYLVSDVELKGKVNGKIRYSILLYVDGENTFNIGDIVSFSTTLYDKDYIYENRYASSDIQKGIKYFAYVNDVEIRVSNNRTTIFEKINLFIRNTLKENLSEKSFPIAYAMLTGDSSFIEGDTLQNFRDAGVAHIFAVSGLHIGVLAVAVTFVLKKLRCNKTLRVVITSLILLFYSGICNFSASSIRAFIMCSAMLSCECFGERYDPLSAIGIAASILLMIDGTNLFSVGFQLSFTVVVGIVTLSPAITRFLKFLPNKIASSLSTAFSAQLFSVPICLYAFGQTSIISVFMNLLFLPIASCVFIFLLICTLLVGVTKLGFILVPAKYMLEFIVWAIGLIDYELFLFGGFTFGAFAVGFYLLWLLVAGLFNVKGRSLIISIILCFVVTVSGTCAVNIIDKNSAKIRVVGSNGISATQIFDGEENFLVVSKFTNTCSIRRLERLATKEDVKVIDNLIILNTGKNSDIHLLITKLLTVFELRNVVYYGEKDYILENAVNISLTGIKISNAIDGFLIKNKVAEYKIMKNGLMFSCKIKSEQIAVFGHIGNNAFDFGSFIKYDYAVAYDYIESLSRKTKAKTFISYKTADGYVNAERSGNLILKIK